MRWKVFAHSSNQKVSIRRVLGSLRCPLVIVTQIEVTFSQGNQVDNIRWGFMSTSHFGGGSLLKLIATSRAHLPVSLCQVTRTWEHSAAVHGCRLPIGIPQGAIGIGAQTFRIANSDLKGLPCAFREMTLASLLHLLALHFVF